MPIITPPAITKQRAVLPTKHCFLAGKHRMAINRLTPGEADESRGQGQMYINQACLRWLGAIFRLQLFRLGIFSIGSKTQAAFPLAIQGQHLRVRPFTAIFFDCRNVWVFWFEYWMWKCPFVPEAITMIKKLISVLSAVVVMSVVAFGAYAADKVNYDAKSFAAAQAAGKPILVEIHATWCPTCKAQAPILSDLEKQDKFRNLTVFHVDFDSQKDAVKAFGARMQSTLITFKGALETGRSVGDTNPTSIAALLDKTT